MANTKKLIVREIIYLFGSKAAYRVGDDGFFHEITVDENQFLVPISLVRVINGRPFASCELADWCHDNFPGAYRIKQMDDLFYKYSTSIFRYLLITIDSSLEDQLLYKLRWL